jgi:hypothetical protein
MKNTITFEGERTSVSSSGNTEWYDYTITATSKLTRSGAIAIGNAHGMGGQETSCEEYNEDGIHIYKCKAKCYCD